LAGRKSASRRQISPRARSHPSSSSVMFAVRWCAAAAVFLLATDGVAALDDNDLDEEPSLHFEYDYDFAGVAESRRFNFSGDIFNNSLVSIGAALIVGIILFGEWKKQLPNYTYSRISILRILPSAG